MATRTTKRSGARKSTSSSRSSRKSQDNENDRYRRAADDALQQLDWAIGYLHGIKKTEISKALAQNRSYIRRNLMGEADEALPDQKTDET
jgi:hypothetical protein